MLLLHVCRLQILLSLCNQLNIFFLFQAYPYQPGPMVVMPPRPPILPRERQPNDYLVITLVVAIACGLLNITSLLFSIAALICSALVSYACMWYD